MWDGFTKRKICIRQHDLYDCGAASLCSIAAWHGLVIPLSRARSLCGCSREGTTIKGILDGARSLGLNGKALKSPQKELVGIMNMETPYIAHIRNEDGMLHFIVVTAISSRSVRVMDPAFGELASWPAEKFLERWSGYIITLAPGPDFRKGEFKLPLWRKLVGVVAPFKFKFIIAMAAGFAMIGAGAANSFILQHLIDVTLLSGSMREMCTISAIVFILAIATMLLYRRKSLLLLESGLEIDHILASSYIKKLFCLPANLYNQFAPGDLNSRIGDIYKTRLFISESLLAVPTCCATLLIVVFLMFWSNSRLAVLSFSFIPLYAVLCIVSVRLNRRHNRDLALLGAQFQNSMLFGMDSIVTAKHFGTEQHAAMKIEERFEALQKEMLDAGRCITGIETAGNGLYGALISSTLVLGGYMVIGGRVTTGELVSFYTLCSLFAAPLDTLVDLHNHYSQACISAERLFEILELEEESDTWSEAPERGKCSNELCTHGEHSRREICKYIIDNDISFANVSFGYPGREKIIDNFSTSFSSGRITALCGSNGSGKSTLGALLMRDLPALEGKIEIGERDISTIPLNIWRSQLCIVPQNIFIFNDTLLNNITCLKEEPDMERVVSACVDAGLASLIGRLPSGVHTHIGSWRGMLSGGEIEKIGIARALYRDPQTYIFDEATANMDEFSERSIACLLGRLKRVGKRVIVITHSRVLRGVADEIVDLG
ncbi:MAG: ATP-binding cassette domain-containing protein [Bacteroidales bacterium]|nr:ATP-binding cassette domain-containing protein [Bacteroidales bacterium]